MSESGSVSEWIEDLRAGKPGAATHLWNRFHANLLKIARRRLNFAARRVTDEEDLVSLAFESFFERLRGGQFPALRGREELWSLLVTITDRKAVNYVRQHLSVKRGSGRVLGESTLTQRSVSGTASLQMRVDAQAGPPDRLATLSELLERLDGDLRRIVFMKRDGYTNEEIAQRVNRSVATIERRLRLLRDEWIEELFG